MARPTPGLTGRIPARPGAAERGPLGLGGRLGQLVSGRKKDLVVTKRLDGHPGRVPIYGRQGPDGHPIQPLSIVHGAGYTDCSHGVCLVSDVVLVDGRFMSAYRVLRDPLLAGLLD